MRAANVVEPSAGSQFKRRKHQRVQEALIRRTGAADHLAHRFAGRDQQFRHRDEFANARTGRARITVEQPERNDAVIDAQHPAFVRLQIGEGELRRVWPREPVGRSYRGEIRHRGVVAREQQVIAVVDHHAELRIVIRAATSARLARRLVHDDTLAPFAQANRGGEAGKPGTDDVDGARHQTNA